MLSMLNGRIHVPRRRESTNVVQNALPVDDEGHEQDVRECRAMLNAERRVARVSCPKWTANADERRSDASAAEGIQSCDSVVEFDTFPPWRK